MHDKSIQQGTGDREEEKKKRIGPHDQQGMRAEFKPRRKERWKCNLVRRVTSTGKRQCLLIQDRPCQWGAHRIFKAILVFREMPFSLPVHLIPASQRPDFWGIVAMPPIAFFRESPDPKGEIVELVDIVGNPGGEIFTPHTSLILWVDQSPSEEQASKYARDRPIFGLDPRSIWKPLAAAYRDRLQASPGPAQKKLNGLR